MKKYLILLFIPMLVFGQFGGGPKTNRIDKIQSEVGPDLVLAPDDKVDIDYFTGEKALQSTADGELEESPITNTELGHLTGLNQNVEDNLNLKALKATLLNTTAPLQGGGDLSADRTLTIDQSDLTEATSSVLTILNGTGSVLGLTGTSIEVKQSGTIQDGYLSATDWNTFDGKQDAITGTNGDLYYYNSGLSNLGIGTLGQLLTVSALGFPEWADAPISTTLDTKGQLQGFSTVNANVGPCVDDEILIYDALEATGWKCSPVPASSPTTTVGDIIYNNTGTLAGDTRLAIGTESQLLTVESGVPAWKDAPVSTTLDTKGDLQTFSTANAKLPVGTDGQMLYADSTEVTGLKWDDKPISTTVSAKGDIQTHDGVENQSQAVGANGTFLMADSDQANGLRWYDAIQTTDWDDTPIGTILAYGSTTPPTGYLLADGACVDRAEYGSLFKVVGTTNGTCDSGTGVDSGFNLPDLVTDNRYIRAAGGSLAVGDTQTDSFASHTHGILQDNNGGALSTGIGSSTRPIQRDYTQQTDSAGGSETRPNTYVALYIIKAKGRDPITSVAQKSMSPDKAGFVIWSAFDGNVEGHLKADGSCVLKETWPDYVSNVGLTTFGECTITVANDGVLLPDLVTDNRFIRSAGGLLAVGDTQTSDNKSHEHNLNAWWTNTGTAYSASNHNRTTHVSSGLVVAGTTVSNSAVDFSGGTESRPNNMALVPYVRMVDRDVIYGNFDAVEEVTAELTLETSNEFKFTGSYVSGTTTHTIVDDVFGIVASVVPQSSSGWLINFPNGTFTITPKVECEAHDSSGSESKFLVYAITKDLFYTQAYAFNGAVHPYNGTYDCTITKSGVDFNKNINGVVIKEKAVQGFQIGDCKISILDDAAFNQLHTGSWAKMSGQSIVGTQLETIGGFSTMPDATTDGAFLRQVGGLSGALRAYQADDNKAHTHTINIGNYSGFNQAFISRGNNVTNGTNTSNSSGGAEARPKNISVNFYCRIN